MVGEEGRPAGRTVPHLVRILFAGQGSGSETRSDLDTLYGIDAHEPGTDVLVELCVKRGPEADRHAIRYDLDHGSSRGAGFPDLVEKRRPCLGSFRIRTEEGVFVHRVPIPVGAVDFVRTDLHQRAAHAHAWHDLACHGPARDPRGRLAGRGPARAAPIAHAVFLQIGVVRMTGAELVLDVPIILGTRIDILNLKRDGRARRDLLAVFGFEYAG